MQKYVSTDLRSSSRVFPWVSRQERIFKVHAFPLEWILHKLIVEKLQRVFD